MNDDMKIAHEYMMACIKAGVPVTIDQAWQYVDGMYIEQDDRIDKSRPEALDDFQVDWSKIPDEYNWFAVDDDGQAYCYSFEPYCSELNGHWSDHDLKYEDGMASNCSDFGYQGYWRQSLRKRPEDIKTKSLVVRDGGYYQDHVNFDYYKFIESQWYRLESILSDTWIKCNQPNLKWLVEDSPLMK